MIYQHSCQILPFFTIKYFRISKRVVRERTVVLKYAHVTTVAAAVIIIVVIFG
jgi:hypothetical protein